jgi:hypothetical protein
MAKTGLVKPITVARVTAGFPDADYAPEAASQTFKLGEGVKYDANGRITAAAIGDTLEGFAAKPGENNSTAGGARSAFYQTREKRKFVGTLTGALAATHRNTAVGFAVDGTTGYWVLSTGAAVKNYRIVGWNETVWSAGDSNARVEFEPLDAAVV